jgi:hypothetical protein
LILRDSPTTKGKQLALMREREEVIVLDDNGPEETLFGKKSRWFKVDYRGVQGFAFGGFLGPPGYSAATELWNGTSWTSNPNSMATARGNSGGAGTQTAGLVFGGYTGTAVVTNTEEFTGPGSPVTQTITTS